MKIQQKMLVAVGTNDMRTSFNKWAEDGWTIVPTTLARGNGDTIMCVIQQEVPEKLPCFGGVEQPKV
jgi:hypothetical protein